MLRQWRCGGAEAGMVHPLYTRRRHHSRPLPGGFSPWCTSHVREYVRSACARRQIIALCPLLAGRAPNGRVRPSCDDLPARFPGAVFRPAGSCQWIASSGAPRPILATTSSSPTVNQWRPAIRGPSRSATLAAASSPKPKGCTLSFVCRPKKRDFSPKFSYHEQ